jgi:hypothetical protein
MQVEYPRRNTGPRSCYSRINTDPLSCRLSAPHKGDRRGQGLILTRHSSLTLARQRETPTVLDPADGEDSFIVRNSVIFKTKEFSTYDNKESGNSVDFHGPCYVSRGIRRPFTAVARVRAGGACSSRPALTFKSRMATTCTRCFGHQSLCILYLCVLCYSCFKRRLFP